MYRIYFVTAYGLQLLSYFILPLLFRVMYRPKAFYKDDLASLGRGSLLVANHQSLLDPFIILAQIPFRVFLRLLPIGFPTAHEWMDQPFRGQLVKFLGCYSIGSTKQERVRVMFHTCKLLRDGRTMMIFPEGERSEGAVGNFQKGIELFARYARQVVFIRMDGFTRALRWKRSTVHRLVFSDVQNLAGQRLDAADLKRHLEQIWKEEAEIIGHEASP